MARFWVTAIDSSTSVEREIEVEAADRDSAARAAHLQLPKGAWIVGNVREAPATNAPTPLPAFVPAPYTSPTEDQQAILDRLDYIAAQLTAIRMSSIIVQPRWTIAEGGLLWVLLLLVINLLIFLISWAVILLAGISILNSHR